MDDLKLIKKHYGEDMMHLCRELFPILIEKGILFEILSSCFDYSKYLYEDIIKDRMVDEFKNFIFNKANVEVLDNVKVNKTPQELLSEAGYKLYECKTEKDIQKFKKYYSKGEELCTFNGGRLDSCYVFFAVKKNVNKIKREDFKFPARQDKYGTSVISIQFSKGKMNTLSIKNRYNHTVNNPDATFSNNLENIIGGLTDSFAKKYNLNILSNAKYNFELDHYVLACDGKYYKYNYEMCNEYFGINNTIIHNHEPIKYDKEKFIVFDYFILDLASKEIKQIDFYDQSFLDSNSCIEKIEIKTNNEDKTKDIIINGGKILIKLNKFNQMISYKNEIVAEIGDSYLSHNQYLKSIELTNIKKITSNFLSSNSDLNELILPNVEDVDDFILCNNICLRSISLPKVKYIGGYFLHDNQIIDSLYLPKVEEIGRNFMELNLSLKKLDLPKIKHIGCNFMSSNTDIEELNLPNLIQVEERFLQENHKLKKVYLPKIIKIGFQFLAKNNSLKEISLPNVLEIDSCFLYSNEKLEKLDLPKIANIGDKCLFKNTNLRTLFLPNVETIGSEFLYYNKRIRSIKLPKVSYISHSFLYCNTLIKKLDLPNLVYVMKDFLRYCQIEKVNLPLLARVAYSNLPYIIEEEDQKLKEKIFKLTK